MFKVLITGVAGFIGSNLAERLISEGNYYVIGIDNLSYGVREQVPDNVEFYKIDIRSIDIFPLFQNIDYVFHLAAKNCINDCQLDPVETVEINVAGTVNIFEAAYKANVKKVIYAESSALYEDSIIYPTPETDIHPRSFYALSKLCNKYFAEAFRRFYNLNTTSLRYFNVYGPRQDYRRTIPPVFSSFIINLLKNKSPVIYGDGAKKRDFIYIDDVNDFHILAMHDSRTDGKTYNIGYGRNYSINDIYKEITSTLEIYLKPIFKEDLPGEAQETLADISNAISIGWYPKTDLKAGLIKSIDYIKNHVIQYL